MFLKWNDYPCRGSHWWKRRTGLGSAPDVVFDFSLGNASNTDGLQLVDCAGTVIDVVIYGESNDDGWTDEQGNVVVSFAPKPGDGASIGRLPDGVGTMTMGLEISES